MTYFGGSSYDDAPPDETSETREERMRRLYDEFEVYYAARDRRRLSEEATVRRAASRQIEAAYTEACGEGPAPRS
jgi:hypothetical protein